MITPRRTRLLRVPDLQAFRRAIHGAGDGAVVIVPTTGAARQLGVGVTRDELYATLHGRLANAPRRLTDIEREAMAQAASRAVAASGVEHTFQLRPGLVAEMLRFYDQLRRQRQSVARFEELIHEALGGEELDRAAARMRLQTRFLAATFREYERRLAECGACDEHTLRDRLVSESVADPVRRLVVTVADWIAEPDGLFAADFDLLSRIAGLETLDVIATEATLGAGFHERVHNWLPGIEEQDVAKSVDAAKPALVTPSGAPPDQPWWVLRDREEELIAVARRARGATHRIAVVYKHPLPYVYLAAEVFRSIGVRCQTADAMPLAAEPTAASLDLVLDVVSSDFSRAALVALLRSPHFAFDVTRAGVSALDRSLSAARYLGDRERLFTLGDDWPARDAAAAPALHAAIAVARELAPLTEPRPASQQLTTLASFWTGHLPPLMDDDPFASRERRARGAIGDLLSAIAAAHGANDDPAWSVDDLAVAVRRWIEDRTFAVDGDANGIHLLDDRAARYGDFDDMTIVGLVEPDWPERPRRNIFYPPSILKALGWASERDRRASDDARFLDLLASAARHTVLSTFTLDDDALVSRSIQLDEVPRARLSIAAVDRGEVVESPSERSSADELMTSTSDEAAVTWKELRASRTPADAPQFHGTVAAPSTVPPRAWAVSALETYLDCPFKFFAQHVLGLEEEPDDEEVMDPRRQGQFVHRVFERFFDAWQRAGNRAITAVNLDEARRMFTDVVDRALEALPPAEGALERTRLLGSPAAAGLGEAVFRMEAERPTPVVERLLEHRLEGEFALTTADGVRTIALRGKADRIDLLEDGTFRLIDYKLGWPPNRARALQLPIYGLCAEQRLASYRGRTWSLGEAAYLAFKGMRRVVPLFTAADRAKVLADAQQRLADTYDAVGRGEFPPTPDDVYRCETCSYAAVCRKDYVGDV